MFLLLDMAGVPCLLNVAFVGRRQHKTDVGLSLDAEERLQTGKNVLKEDTLFKLKGSRHKTHYSRVEWFVDILFKIYKKNMFSINPRPRISIQKILLIRGKVGICTVRNNHDEKARIQQQEE